ncbi:MAG TPA: flavin reductase family protein [Silvibacterium sp.]|nr:flavin reductase family protein [Silvibacterium sp.]
MAMLRFDSASSSPSDIYKLMIGMVVPRPIAFVSSLDEHGVRNLAPFSYFMACTSNPPVVCFVSSFRSGTLPAKDTLRNIVATKEFVVNIVSEEFADKMNLTSAEVPPEIDEFELSGLTPVASELIKPPRVAESHAQMECRLRQLLEIGNQTGGGTIIFGDVLRFHVDEAVVDGYKIDPEKLKAVGRMGGPTYVRTRDRFDMIRPK